MPCNFFVNINDKMWCMLKDPKTEKSSEQGEGNKLRYGLAAMQGRRKEMEDAHMSSS